MGQELSLYAEKRRKRTFWRNAFLLLLILSVLGAGYFFLSKYFFVIKSIQVQETSLYTKEEILAVTSMEMGQPLQLVSKKEEIRAIEENFPFLVDVHIKFHLPNEVEIQFTEDFGDFLVTLGEESFAVDRDLNVLAKINDSGVSRIRLISRDVSRCVVGEKLSFFDPTIGDSVLQFIQTLESEEMIGQVSEIDLQDKFYIRIRYLDRFDVILGENSDLPYKFAMLRGVVADLYPEAKGEIDVTDPNTAYVRLNHE